MANFMAWVTGFEAESGRGSATLNVVARNIARIKDGTQEFVGDLVVKVGLPLRLESWQVSAFRSPYYSEYPDSGDWRDVFPSVWEVAVFGQLDGPPPDRIPVLAPVEFNGADKTWHPLREEPASQLSVCKLIGAAVGDEINGETTRAQVAEDWPEASVTVAVDVRHGAQVILGLGEVDLVAARPRLDRAVATLESQGLAVTWRRTKARIQGLPGSR